MLALLLEHGGSRKPNGLVEKMAFIETARRVGMGQIERAMPVNNDPKGALLERAQRRRVGAMPESVGAMPLSLFSGPIALTTRRVLRCGDAGGIEDGIISDGARQ